METNNLKERRRFIMMLPLLTTPFLVLIFWALGGGQGTVAKSAKVAPAGLNPDLPSAQIAKNKNEWDKMELYQRAAHDSLKYEEAKRNDPYFNLPLLRSGEDSSGTINASLGKKKFSFEEQDKKVSEQIQELYKQIDAPGGNAKDAFVEPQSEIKDPANIDDNSNPEIDRLENLIRSVQGDSTDPEMESMKSVLDRIIDIQHPERLDSKLAEDRARQNANSLPVTEYSGDGVSLLKPGTTIQNPPYEQHHEVENRFFGLSETNVVETNKTSIVATVYNDQQVITGSVVRLQLMHDVFVKNAALPKGSFLNGIASLNGERLMISIKSVRVGNSILPIALNVYDLDGLEGIYVPNMLPRTVAKQSAGQEIQGLGSAGTVGTSFGAQAASAGIETVRSFLSRKTRLIKVNLKAGYQVLLQDNAIK